MSRYVPEKLAGVDQAAAAFEGEIHELIQRVAESRAGNAARLMPPPKT